MLFAVGVGFPLFLSLCHGDKAELGGEPRDRNFPAGCAWAAPAPFPGRDRAQRRSRAKPPGPWEMLASWPAAFPGAAPAENLRWPGVGSRVLALMVNLAKAPRSGSCPDSASLPVFPLLFPRFPYPLGFLLQIPARAVYFLGKKI